MSKVISIGTSVGKYEVTQKDIKQLVYELFSGCKLHINSLIKIFDNSAINKRYLSVPLKWFKAEHSFSEKNNYFIENAVDLSINAINDCISSTEIDITDIDHIFFITTTGLSTPSIDALLLNKLKFKNHIKRTPIWGIGCAGGAVGLSRAMEYTMAFPKETAIVIAVELCSLTFQKDDLSKSNIVASSLFSDGAAAVLITGNQSKFSQLDGLELIDSLSSTYYDSLDVMGWNIIDTGFKVLFSKDIPKIVQELVKQNIEEFLSIKDLSINDIKHFITHPGGMKVILAYERSLGLHNCSLDLVKDVLKEYGNMSSPTVLFVLKNFLNEKKYISGEFGLISSLGPGFSSELLLFKTA